MVKKDKKETSYMKLHKKAPKKTPKKKHKSASSEHLKDDILTFLHLNTDGTLDAIVDEQDFSSSKKHKKSKTKHTAKKKEHPKSKKPAKKHSKTKKTAVHHSKKKSITLSEADRIAAKKLKEQAKSKPKKNAKTKKKSKPKTTTLGAVDETAANALNKQAPKVGGLNQVHPDANKKKKTTAKSKSAKKPKPTVPKQTQTGNDTELDDGLRRELSQQAAQDLQSGNLNADPTVTSSTYWNNDVPGIPADSSNSTVNKPVSDKTSVKKTVKKKPAPKKPAPKKKSVSEKTTKKPSSKKKTTKKNDQWRSIEGGVAGSSIFNPYHFGKHGDTRLNKISQGTKKAVKKTARKLGYKDYVSKITKSPTYRKIMKASKPYKRKHQKKRVIKKGSISKSQYAFSRKVEKELRQSLRILQRTAKLGINTGCFALKTGARSVVFIPASVIALTTGKIPTSILAKDKGNVPLNDRDRTIVAMANACRKGQRMTHYVFDPMAKVAAMNRAGKQSIGPSL